MFSGRRSRIWAWRWSSIEEMLKEGATLTLEPETAPELPVEEAKPIR